ncbi:hypothetical protein G4B88_003960 [Cannabis sativa]|uniref:Disease resistance R13L4/SHOC-2-like LRR domain-containing protein n=1 Tax=Cannabis sativa TaxID=3483 RepID=A0A7J6GXH0_CANSA|nr:hypothetical protein G4B88_003960 [Cannabis sativa]
MHDLIVDLANHVSKKKFVYIEKGKRYDIGHVRQIRHIAFEEDINCHDFHETYKIISEAICLRTFMPVTKYYYLRLNTLHEDVLKDIMKLRRLRFLSLAGYENVSELPKSIGQLIHLHHLDLSYTSIKELPKSVCLLYNLQTLKLCGCKHLVKFPKNIHRLINLRYLYMSFCEFSTLPPLGQLPSLVTLLIEECASVEMVGLEFYGSSSSKSFPLLESLTLKRMSKWKEWSPPKANLEVFPKLTSLTIHRCEKLTGDLPWLLPSLTELDIFYCPKLASSLPVIPTITTIRVQHCAKIIGFKPCSNLQNFDDLEKLYLEGCSFKLLPLDSFPNIWNITIRNCESLESFSLLNSLKSLSTLSIQQCPNFTLNLDSNIHCPILTQLEFCSCHNLKFLPKNLSSLLPSLLELIILDCPNLESLPKFELPFNLRELTIRKCNKFIASRKNWNLQALPNLTSFCIGDYECEDMESFLEQGLLPTSLTSLKISGVACLKTLEEKGFQELKSLKELHIYMCPNLQSLPVKGLPPFFEGLLPPSFETFVMDYCPLLEKRMGDTQEVGIDVDFEILCSAIQEVMEPYQVEINGMVYKESGFLYKGINFGNSGSSSSSSPLSRRILGV